MREKSKITLPANMGESEVHIHFGEHLEITIEKPTMTSIDYKSEVLRVEPMAYEHCDSSGYCQIRIAGDMPLTYNIAADNSWQAIAWQSAFFTLKQRGRL